MNNKSLLSLIFMFYMMFCPCFAQTISGQVEKADMLNQNQVIDKTGQGVEGARVSIPQNRYTTYTDNNGNFKLNTKIDSDVILSVEKAGYRPFSITIDKQILDGPLKIGIEQAKRGDIVIDTSLYHLGDNNFSPNSANSGEFKVQAAGIYLSKKFEMEPIDEGGSAYLIIGSIIGLDTKMAKELRQNSIQGSYSSPAQIFFNGQKIGELKINGDNQRIPIPSPLISKNNELIIKTGRNLFQRNFADYDDIEVMNLSIEVTEKQVFSYMR